MPVSRKYLHPSALGIKDLTVGRGVVAFSLYDGVLGYYVVLERPSVRKTVFENRTTRSLMVKMRNCKTGMVGYHYLSDLGVLPRISGLGYKFVVDHRKAHLLPAKLKLHRQRVEGFGFFDDGPRTDPPIREARPRQETKPPPKFRGASWR